MREVCLYCSKDEKVAFLHAAVLTPEGVEKARERGIENPVTEAYICWDCLLADFNAYDVSYRDTRGVFDDRPIVSGLKSGQARIDGWQPKYVWVERPEVRPLEKYIGETITVTAKVDGFGDRKSQLRVLLTEVSLKATGEKLADHLWITVPSWEQYVYGNTISLEGKVVSYRYAEGGANVTLEPQA